MTISVGRASVTPSRPTSVNSIMHSKPLPHPDPVGLPTLVLPSAPVVSHRWKEPRTGAIPHPQFFCLLGSFLPLQSLLCPPKGGPERLEQILDFAPVAPVRNGKESKLEQARFWLHPQLQGCSETPYSGITLQPRPVSRRAAGAVGRIRNASNPQGFSKRFRKSRRRRWAV